MPWLFGSLCELWYIHPLSSFHSEHMYIHKHHFVRLERMACFLCIFVCILLIGTLSNQNVRLGMNMHLLTRWKSRMTKWVWFSNFHPSLLTSGFQSFCVCLHLFAWQESILYHPCLSKKILGTDHRDSPTEWRTFRKG